jgi:hypothetical protein
MSGRAEAFRKVRERLRDTSAILEETRRALAQDPDSRGLQLMERSLTRRKKRTEARAVEMAQYAFDRWVYELLEFRAEHKGLSEAIDVQDFEYVPADEVADAFLAENPDFEPWREVLHDHAQNSSKIKAYGGFPLTSCKWREHKRLQSTATQ